MALLGEADFAFDDLFFSRTDLRGVIQAGNSVFQRISCYSWPELLQKPHKIIRHPDMPRAVFYLLWDYLKKGRAIGAYVKNRTKDGRYYWVFALATPMEGGYLSVRLKPSSAIFNIVREEYQALLAHERATSLPPEQSAEVLLQAIRKLGFKDYDEFMSVALAAEISSRDAHLARRKDPLIEMLEGLLLAARRLIDESAAVVTSYEANKFVPLNLQIQSAQLGEEGNAIGVISGDYGVVSDEIRDGVRNLGASAARLLDVINLGNFVLCTVRLQTEVIAVFRDEVSDEGGSRDVEMSHLDRQRQAFRESAGESLRSILKEVESFQQNCRTMKTLASSLDVIRIMGKLNAASLSTSNEVLEELMNELKLFQSSISDSLGRIEQTNHDLEYTMQSVLRTLEPAAG